jgi:hypothetical protein
VIDEEAARNLLSKKEKKSPKPLYKEKVINLWMKLLPAMIMMRKAHASQSYKTNLGLVS